MSEAVPEAEFYSQYRERTGDTGPASEDMEAVGARTKPRRRSAVSIGRIVHYVARGSADGHFPPVCRAAIISGMDVERNGWTVALAVLNPNGMFFNNDCPHDPGDSTQLAKIPTLTACSNDPESIRMYRPGTWHFCDK